MLSFYVLFNVYMAVSIKHALAYDWLEVNEWEAWRHMNSRFVGYSLYTEGDAWIGESLEKLCFSYINCQCFLYQFSPVFTEQHKAHSIWKYSKGHEKPLITSTHYWMFELDCIILLRVYFAHLFFEKGLWFNNIWTMWCVTQDTHWLHIKNSKNL